MTNRRTRMIWGLSSKHPGQVWKEPTHRHQFFLWVRLLWSPPFSKKKQLEKINKGCYSQTSSKRIYLLVLSFQQRFKDIKKECKFYRWKERVFTRQPLVGKHSITVGFYQLGRLYNDSRVHCNAASEQVQDILNVELFNCLVLGAKDFLWSVIS